jgi:hypothetical protein
MFSNLLTKHVYSVSKSVVNAGIFGLFFSQTKVKRKFFCQPSLLPSEVQFIFSSILWRLAFFSLAADGMN